MVARLRTDWGRNRAVHQVTNAARHLAQPVLHVQSHMRRRLFAATECMATCEVVGLCASRLWIVGPGPFSTTRGPTNAQSHGWGSAGVGGRGPSTRGQICTNSPTTRPIPVAATAWLRRWRECFPAGAMGCTAMSTSSTCVARVFVAGPFPKVLGISQCFAAWLARGRISANNTNSG